jgi:hypothetical protein
VELEPDRRETEEECFDAVAGEVEEPVVNGVDVPDYQWLYPKSRKARRGAVRRRRASTSWERMGGGGGGGPPNEFFWWTKRRRKANATQRNAEKKGEKRR